MEVGIIGSGVIGLTSALALVQAGYSVTIVARELPGDDSLRWASPWAGAGILPYPDSAGHDLQAETFKYYWALAHRDPTSGVQVTDVTEYYDDRSDDATIWYKTLVPKYRRLPSENLPANAKLGFQYKSMTVNPAVFLPWIKILLEREGVKFIRAEIESINHTRSLLKTEIIVNASGLGARVLANDEKVVAVRGQTMLVESDSHEMVMFQGSHYTYQIPRMYSGGVIIGGVSQEGVTDESVDLATRADILRRTNLITHDRFRSLDLNKHVMKDLVGLRPSRKGGYRLEREGSVVHAYGFNTLGYTYSYGVALKVQGLVTAALEEKRSQKSRL
ncbi:hypothetical protein CBS147343_9839 [Aspergillus niger]|nr:hypothetical protein CBS13152_10825 [Aspergillus niger]KAI2910690.1 hypothetical protein CBS147371_8682 [Aspergillus niger]KAI2912604.1 hypothetical protein CBS147320_10831 [Aspergillus niger]KAI2957736.1 hypothetical protein CBS147323_8842 [Aspergillus niger]KAI2975658.1 hypothetical protein CBS147324_2993 [Aspergillus niger]